MCKGAHLRELVLSVHFVYPGREAQVVSERLRLPSHFAAARGMVSEMYYFALLGCLCFCVLWIPL